MLFYTVVKIDVSFWGKKNSVVWGKDNSIPVKSS
jgi:hypothetical protein